MFKAVKTCNEDAGFLDEVSRWSFYVFKELNYFEIMLLLSDIPGTLFARLLLSASRSGTTLSR